LAKWWTRKRRINAAVLVAWLVFLGLILQIPLSYYGSQVFQTEYTGGGFFTDFQLSSYPSLTFNYTVTFSTVGTFSAYDLIQFNAVVYNVNNPTALSEYYKVAQFTNASWIEYGSDGNLSLGSGGRYYATGEIAFAEGGNTWFFLGPYHVGPLVNPEAKAELAKTPPTLTISPVSDSLTVAFNEAAIRYALIIGSFSILLLQPIIEGIVLREKKDE